MRIIHQIFPTKSHSTINFGCIILLSIFPNIWFNEFSETSDKENFVFLNINTTN